MQLVQDALFERQDYIVNALPKGEYENCNFNGCNFASADIIGIVFTDCTFTDCNFSMANTKGAAFKEVSFNNCKMTGINFSVCEPFLLAMTFNGCQLNLASFYNLKLKSTRFTKCILHEADMVQTDFSGASFTDSDLRGAIFENTILEKADFRSAINYTIDPEANRIKKAKFSLQGLPGLLHKYSIDIS